jgi:hypothetical protein
MFIQVVWGRKCMRKTTGKWGLFISEKYKRE